MSAMLLGALAGALAALVLVWWPLWRGGWK